MIDPDAVVYIVDDDPAARASVAALVQSNNVRTREFASAEEFLEQSIVEPDAEITENFSPGVMYQNYGTDLTDQEIADLVAFLASLK